LWLLTDDDGCLLRWSLSALNEENFWNLGLKLGCLPVAVSRLMEVLVLDLEGEVGFEILEVEWEGGLGGERFEAVCRDGILESLVGSGRSVLDEVDRVGAEL
jgi:hypothetical protein